MRGFSEMLVFCEHCRDSRALEGTDDALIGPLTDPWLDPHSPLSTIAHAIRMATTGLTASSVYGVATATGLRQGMHLGDSTSETFGEISCSPSL